MNQIVYILINEAMPDYIKIGYTRGDLNQRLKSLDRTGTPLPFEIYYAGEVENASDDEAWLHRVFGDRRVRDNREFFKMNPEYAAIALRRIQIKEVEITRSFTPEQIEQIEEFRQRRSRFHFANYGINIGDELSFTRNPTIKAKVAKGDKITINGVTDSLSNFAQTLLGYKHKPQGTLYFMYKDEILDDMRKRIDTEISQDIDS